MKRLLLLVINTAQLYDSYLVLVLSTEQGGFMLKFPPNLLLFKSTNQPDEFVKVSYPQETDSREPLYELL